MFFHLCGWQCFVAVVEFTTNECLLEHIQHNCEVRTHGHVTFLAISLSLRLYDFPLTLFSEGGQITSPNRNLEEIATIPLQLSGGAWEIRNGRFIA
jgi:hypothetical protein